MRLSTVLLAAATILHGPPAHAQGQPPASSVPDPYRQKFVRYVDNRTLKETMLNAVGLTGNDVGRSFALIAGVSQYPDMRGTEKTLPAAAADIDLLKNYLINQEMFDEVVVLKDGDMTAENLHYFMESYFPARLQQFPKSRFLFAYSGHGIPSPNPADNHGFILTSAARDFKDTEHAINMTFLRVYMDELAVAGYQTLALINACHSGDFIHPAFGDPSLIPKQPGAHAITAGGSDQKTWGDPDGSFFFKALLRGLGGQADFLPEINGHKGDGIITVEEIYAYLKQEVGRNTSQAQTPILSDLRPAGSDGGFFFLNRNRMVARGFVPPFDFTRHSSFGIDAEVTLKNAKDLYSAQKYAAALPLFRKSAEDGNAEAARYLGSMYDKGLGTTPDQTQSVFWDRRAAEGGDPVGMAYLGFDYEQGVGGLPIDDTLAVRWYQKGADGGSSFAMEKLGVKYQYGEGGLPTDDVQAVSWYRKAAEKGSARAMAELGVMYEDGKGGLATDPGQAIKWYRKAADAGDAMGMNNLAEMYDYGKGGLVTDAVQAVSWYRKAAEAGYAPGMANLGIMYEEGNGGLPTDAVQAVAWYRKAAEAGDAHGMSLLAFMYERGRGGLPADASQALSWFRKAAEAGDEIAMGYLGSRYEYGRDGLPKDDVQALSWYRKAAEAGSTTAMIDLGRMFEDGRGGLARNVNEAIVWYRKAADLGNLKAKQALERLHR